MASSRFESWQRCETVTSDNTVAKPEALDLAKLLRVPLVDQLVANLEAGNLVLDEASATTDLVCTPADTNRILVEDCRVRHFIEVKLR